MTKVILTADSTLMSNYHKYEFLGFGTTVPLFELLPEFLYRWLFFPPQRTKDGVAVEAPYGLRKIEAVLIENAFDVLTVCPEHIHKYVHLAKALGIYTMDPLGLGPSSSTFSKIFGREDPLNKVYFIKLLTNPYVKLAKKKGLKIIVGGPGSWQLKLFPDLVDKLGIDCIIYGEGEKIAPYVFRKALQGEPLEKYIEVDSASPSLEEIPSIKNPAINGLIEIGRGCPRGCDYCSVTLRPLRWYPLVKIEEELKITSKLGRCILHAEDVMLYGSSSTFPNEKKVVKVNELAKKYCKKVSWSHCSLAAVAACPSAIEKCAEIIIDENQTMWGSQIGIETGSPRIVKLYMPAKSKPFPPEQWTEVVKYAAGVLTDNYHVGACTLIIGLPNEEPYDVIKTIELVEDLRFFRSLIIPLFFTPLGKLKNEKFFQAEELHRLHKELITVCVKHDLYWVRDIMWRYFDKSNRHIILPSFLVFTKILGILSRRVIKRFVSLGREAPVERKETPQTCFSKSACTGQFVD